MKSVCVHHNVSSASRLVYTFLSLAFPVKGRGDLAGGVGLLVMRRRRVRCLHRFLCTLQPPPSPIINSLAKC